MNLKKLALVLGATLLSGLSAQASCYWVKVDARFLECRTPLNRMIMSDTSRSLMMKTILHNSKSYLDRVFNNSEVMDILIGGESLDTRLIEKARKTLAQSDETVDLMNQLTSIAEVVLAPEEPSRSQMPAALIVGFILSTQHGIIPLPGPVASLFRSAGSLTVGGGSLLFAAVTVPYVVEFVAENVGTEDDTPRTNPMTVFHDRSAGFKVYRTDLPFRERLGFDYSFRMFPNLDLRVSQKGLVARTYKTDKVLINVGAAWGSTILRPDDLGPWGLSYSQPTASNTSTPFFNSLYSKELVKPFKPLANYSLAGLNRMGVDSLKVSFNSRTEFWSREFHSFDQTLVLLRWPMSLRAKDKDLIPSGRLGVNIGLDLLNSLNVFGNVVASVERADHVRIDQEDSSLLNLDQRLLQHRLKQALGDNFEEPAHASGEFLPPPIPSNLKRL